jgi:hypothetical protein
MTKAIETKEVAIFPLRSHSLKGGYIYIPRKFRNRLPKKQFIADFRYKKKQISLSVLIDTNGRLKSVQPSKDPLELKSWYNLCRIKPDYEVAIYKKVDKKKKTLWEVIIQPPYKSSQSMTPKDIIPGTTNQFGEMASFFHDLGSANFLKGAALMDDVSTLINDSFDEILDPTRETRISIKECNMEIKQDKRLYAFFKLYWESSIVRRVFSVRAEDLFPQLSEEESEEIEEEPAPPNYLFYLLYQMKKSKMLKPLGRQFFLNFHIDINPWLI